MGWWVVWFGWIGWIGGLVVVGCSLLLIGWLVGVIVGGG